MKSIQEIEKQIREFRNAKSEFQELYNQQQMETVRVEMKGLTDFVTFSSPIWVLLMGASCRLFDTVKALHEAGVQIETDETIANAENFYLAARRAFEDNGISSKAAAA